MATARTPLLSLRPQLSVEEFIARYIQLHAPHVRDAVAALVLDMFAAPMVDVARDLGVPSYVFMSSTSAMLALMLHLPVLHERVTVEFDEVDGNVDVPGLPPLPPESMPCRARWWTRRAPTTRVCITISMSGT
uniref:Uncharacterized protein n=1 Tax=Oryza meridionalis TaxID=40149 RepID=A0A0E0CQ11_9ORYZ